MKKQFPKPGTIIDQRYKLEKQIGIGGMGAVYKASCLQLADQLVAIKILKPTIQENDEFRKRFEREARIASQLNHPSIVKVTDYGLSDQQLLYMVLEYVEGRELRGLIKDAGEISIPRAANIATACLAALATAHQAGVIHRDLKPRNIMIESYETAFGPQDQIKILDFGIARVDDGESLTAPGQVLGTVAYMAPEQTRLGKIDHRIDLYAIGCILFEMLCGRPPFVADSIEEMIKKQRKAPIPDPAQFRANLPPALSQTLIKALAKSPDDRFQSAEEFMQALQQALLNPTGNAPASSVEINPAESGFGMSPQPLNSSQSSSGSVHDVTAITPPPMMAAQSQELSASQMSSQMSNQMSSSIFTRLEGQVIDGKYQIVEKLGEGGMGAVYKARHLMLGTDLALKVMHPQHAQDMTFKERFQREVKVMMTFVHSNAVTVRDYGLSSHGLLYMTMDFSQGQPLKALIQSSAPIPYKRALNISRQILAALSAGHKKAIVHRDIKPDNILVENDNGQDFIKVLDFGIAKILEKEGANDKPGLTGSLVIGTPHYMSPEQANGESVDPRADLYAVGCVLYEMLSGEKVFQGTTVMQTLMAHVSQAPTPLSERVPELNIPTNVENLVNKALSKNPDQRFASATKFIKAIDTVLEAKPGSTPPPVSDNTVEVSSATVIAELSQDSPQTSNSAPQVIQTGSSNSLLTVTMGVIILSLVGLVAFVSTQNQSRVVQTNTPQTNATPDKTNNPPINNTNPDSTTDTATDTPEPTNEKLPRAKPVAIDTKKVNVEIPADPPEEPLPPANDTTKPLQPLEKPAEPTNTTPDAKTPEDTPKPTELPPTNPPTDPKPVDQPKTPEAAPKPEPKPEPTPEPKPEPVPEPKPEPKPEPIATPEPTTSPVTEPEPTKPQEPAVAPKPTPTDDNPPVVTQPEPVAKQPEPVTEPPVDTQPMPPVQQPPAQTNPDNTPPAQPTESAKPTRATIAVLPFTFRSENVAEYSQKFVHSIRTEQTEQLTAELTRELVQTKKFVVVERQNVDKAIREQDWAQSGRLDPKQSVEYAKMLGATYLVTGELSFESFQSNHVPFKNFGINQTTSTHSLSIVVEIRVIDSNTTQVVEALKIPGRAERKFVGKTRVLMTASLAKSMILEARKNLLKNCAWKIINRVYPLKVAKVEAGTVYLNRGKNANLRPGQLLNVFENGDAIKDPDTQVVLGYKRSKIGQLRIVQVDQYYATAVIITGRVTDSSICEIDNTPKPEPKQNRPRVPGW